MIELYNNEIYVLGSYGLSFTSKIIKFWQFGFPITHIAVVIDLNNPLNPYIAEMWKNGLQVNNFYDSHTKGTPFAIYGIQVTEEQKNLFRYELYKFIQRKPKYDWFGILGFPFRNTHFEKKDRFFCSEMVFYLFKKIGIELLARTKPSEVSPRIFMKSPYLRFVYYWDGVENLITEKEVL